MVLERLAVVVLVVPVGYSVVQVGHLGGGL